MGTGGCFSGRDKKHDNSSTCQSCRSGTFPCGRTSALGESDMTVVCVLNGDADEE